MNFISVILILVLLIIMFQKNPTRQESENKNLPTATPNYLSLIETTRPPTQPQIQQSQIQQKQSQIQQPQIQQKQSQIQQTQPRNIWNLIGLVYSESITEDSVLELYKKESNIKQKFLYKVKDPHSFIEINLNNGQEMKELYSDDKIDILSKTGVFIVLLNKPIPITRSPINSLQSVRQQNNNQPGYSFDYEIVGIVYSKSETDDSIYQLFQKKYHLQRDRFIYKIKDTIKNIYVNLFYEEPVKKLESKDEINIITKESIGKFIVQLNE